MRASAGHRVSVRHGSLGGLDYYETVQAALDDFDRPPEVVELKFGRSLFGGDLENVIAGEHSHPDHHRIVMRNESHSADKFAAISKFQRGRTVLCFQVPNLGSFFGTNIMRLEGETSNSHGRKRRRREASLYRRARGFDCGYAFHASTGHHDLKFHSFNAKDRKTLVANDVKDLLGFKGSDVPFSSRLNRLETGLTIKNRAIFKSQRGRTDQSLHFHLQVHCSLALPFSIARDKDSKLREMS